MYLDANDLDVKLLGRGFAWLDTGTIESLMRANDFIKIIEEGQNIKIAVLEEIAYKNGWISNDKLIDISKQYNNSEYGKYLKNIAEGKMRYINY